MIVHLRAGTAAPSGPRVMCTSTPTARLTITSVRRAECRRRSPGLPGGKVQALLGANPKDGLVCAGVARAGVPSTWGPANSQTVSFTQRSRKGIGGRPRGGPTAVIRLPLPVAALARRLAEGTLRAGDINEFLNVQTGSRVAVPFAGVAVECGFPSPAEDYLRSTSTNCWSSDRRSLSRFRRFRDAV